MSFPRTGRRLVNSMTKTTADLASDDGVMGPRGDRPKGYAFSEMTGVLAPNRGQGLSLALKLLAIRFVRSSGYRRLVTFHHPGNTSAIAMNRRLAFVVTAAEDQVG